MANKKNKKGQGLVEVFSWFLALLFTIIFFILFNIPRCKGDIPEQRLDDEDLSTLQDEFNLVSFLRTPVTVEGQAATMSELIILYKQNPDKYGDELKEKAWGALLELKYIGASLCVDDTRINLGYELVSASCNENEQKIPSVQENITVKIGFYEVED